MFWHEQSSSPDHHFPFPTLHRPQLNSLSLFRLLAMKTTATLVSALLYSTISVFAKADHHHIAHAVEKRGGQYSGQATWFVDGLVRK